MKRSFISSSGYCKMIAFVFLSLTFFLDLTDVASSLRLEMPMTNLEYLKRIISGTNTFIIQAKAQHEGLYPIWRAGSGAHGITVIENNSAFAEGVFYGYTRILSASTGVNFDEKLKTQLMVILSDTVNSWGDADVEISRNHKKDFSIPDDARSRPFTGCNFAQYSAAGNISGAILIVNTKHAKETVESCVYRSLFSTFGFQPSDAAYDAVFDLAVLRALYNLTVEHRQIDRVVGFIVRSLSGRPL